MLSQQEIPLWADQEAPWSKSHAVEEHVAPCWLADCAYQVVDPTLTIYRPEGSGNGNVVLVIPGGGYDVVAIFHEGFEIAEALAAGGTTAAVLKYRLPHPDTATHPELVPLSDAQRAIWMLRNQQQELGISTRRVGVMGFSAGAHLSVIAGLDNTVDAALKPDFMMLIYGVSRLDETNRLWLEKSLYHRPLTAEEVQYETILERVDTNTPPAFMVHAMDDEICHFTETTLLADAMTRHEVDVEVHLFPEGGHGFGVGRAEDGTDQWLQLATNWLNRLD